MGSCTVRLKFGRLSPSFFISCSPEFFCRQETPRYLNGIDSKVNDNLLIIWSLNSSYVSSMHNELFSKFTSSEKRSKACTAAIYPLYKRIIKSSAKWIWTRFSFPYLRWYLKLGLCLNCLRIYWDILWLKQIDEGTLDPLASSLDVRPPSTNRE